MANDNDVEYMLSTLDNPFNPFIDFDSWYQYDVSNGYNSCSYLDRIVKTSDELSDADQSLAIYQGIEEILELNITGKYIKVDRNYIPQTNNTE